MQGAQLSDRAGSYLFYRRGQISLYDARAARALRQNEAFLFLGYSAPHPRARFGGETLFTLCNEHKKGSISLRRALDISWFSKPQKNQLKAKSRHAKRLSDALILAATDELNVAGEAHFELEKIYRENMDFSTLNV